MKSVCTAILLIIHFVVTTGFSVRTHFCMGKIDTITLVAAESKQCSVCGMHTNNSNGCCRDEIKIVKLHQDQQVAKVILPSFSADLYTLPAPFATGFTGQGLSFPVNQFTNPPPVGRHVPVYIQNRVFRV